MTRNVGIIVLSFLFAWLGNAFGQTPPLEEVVAKVQEQYEKNSDFKAEFVQESLVKSLGKKQQADGVVYFKKPGKMHWIYNKPTKQEIISDGKNLWSYRPDDKQVIVSRMTQAFQSKAPSTFLAGLGNLQKDFQSRFAKTPTAGAPYALELIPREAQGGLEKLSLLVEQGTYNILQATIQDAMGNITQISFSKIRFNNRLADSLFTFTPPKGVEVFNLPGASPSEGPSK